MILNIFIGFSFIRAQQVIATAGEHYSNESYQISWTLGEPVIETASNEDIILTQGMHQGNIEVSSIWEAEEFNSNITVFPNPTISDVTIRLNELPEEGTTKPNHNLFASLYDIKGNLLEKRKLSATTTTFSMEEYAPSVYILKITDSKNKVFKTLQIVKN